MLLSLKEFVNEEDDYEGPEVIEIQNILSDKESGEDGKCSVFVGYVKEYNINHKLFSLESIPKTVKELVEVMS